jgi:hypothetical protein
MYKILFTWSGSLVALCGAVALFFPPHTFGTGLILLGWMLVWIGAYEETSTRLATIEAYQRLCAEHLEKIAKKSEKKREYNGLV